MRRRNALPLVVTFLLLAAAPAAASPPQTQTITSYRTMPGGPPDGWTSTGPVFTDSGSWLVDHVIQGPLPSPTTFAFHSYTTLTGVFGTITLSYFGQGGLRSEQVLGCNVEHGTGVYAKLTGHGTWD